MSQAVSLTARQLLEQILRRLVLLLVVCQSLLKPTDQFQAEPDAFREDLCIVLHLNQLLWHGFEFALMVKVSFCLTLRLFSRVLGHLNIGLLGCR